MKSYWTYYMVSLLKIDLIEITVFYDTVDIMNFLTMLLFMLCFIGHVLCWLDALRTFPIERQAKHKRNNSSRTLHGNKKLFGCRKDRHCKPEQFCHRYERLCMACRTEGQTCRRNKMCCRGMECAGGKCRIKVQLGRLGALCTKDRECNYGFCCAREKGQSICKPMLREGNACGIPEGGRRYFWTHQCPCAYGLKCKVAKKKLDNKLNSMLRDWNDGIDRRCLRPKIT